MDFLSFYLCVCTSIIHNTPCPNVGQSNLSVLQVGRGRGVIPGGGLGQQFFFPRYFHTPNIRTYVEKKEYEHILQ